jgi:hypothetical protein
MQSEGKTCDIECPCELLVAYLILYGRHFIFVIYRNPTKHHKKYLKNIVTLVYFSSFTIIFSIFFQPYKI